MNKLNSLYRISILLIVFFYFSIKGIHAQTAICQGNLGENIFTAGNFGSGSANNLATNPGIAPGYTYENAPPPNDGFYTITNNTGRWANIYSSWLNIRDNSPDPNGYMMVVNASNNPGLFYEQIVDGLCENTLYEFSADIINMIRIGVTGHSDPNVSFLIDGEVIISTGNIAATEKWNTYGFTFTTAIGQQNVRLSLRNNAPGGTGNDLALDNISLRACGPEALISPTTIADICEDGAPITLDATVIGTQFSDPFVQWQRSNDNGQTWETILGETNLTYEHTELSSGLYYYRFLLAGSEVNIQNSKCHIISNIKIVNVVPKEHEIVDSICAGLNYTLGTQSFTETGVFTEQFISSIGCDSIVTLNLTVIPDPSISVDIKVTDLSCVSSNDGSVNIITIENAFPPYQSFFSTNTDTLFDFNNLNVGDYNYSIIDRFGCTFSEEIQINAPPKFIINLGSDKYILLGDAVQINPSSNFPINSYNWFSNTIIDCSLTDCENPLIYPIGNDTVLLVGISERNCIDTSILFIQVDKTARIFIPNSFSPNDDAINDYFTVLSHQTNVKRIDNLSIFNRWGVKVFERENFIANEPTLGWDGTINGKLASEGTYVYLATIRLLDDSIESHSGDLFLIR